VRGGGGTTGYKYKRGGEPTKKRREKTDRKEDWPGGWKKRSRFTRTSIVLSKGHFPKRETLKKKKERNR